ncbi:MAG: response regulator [Bdellovibrionota bacterium]
MEPLDNRIRTLVVDDVRTARIVIMRLLNEIGFKNIEEARSGKEALEKLSKESFQLVISDQVMPDLSGLQLVTKIRANQALKDIPFIMVTSTAEREKVLEAVNAGVSDYIVKPVSMDILVRKIRHVLSDLATKQAVE